MVIHIPMLALISVSPMGVLISTGTATNGYPGTGIVETGATIGRAVVKLTMITRSRVSFAVTRNLALALELGLGLGLGRVRVRDLLPVWVPGH